MRFKCDTVPQDTEGDKVNLQRRPLWPRGDVELAGECLEVCVASVQLAGCEAMCPVVRTMGAAGAVGEERSGEIGSIVDVAEQALDEFGPVAALATC